jgi:hypothetical protein
MTFSVQVSQIYVVYSVNVINIQQTKFSLNQKKKDMVIL